MADNNFRSYSNRDSRARAEPLRDSASDPLAELARLIGQGDPYAERNSGRSADDAATPGFDWAANEDYAEPQGHAEEHYAPPPLPPASYPAYAHGEQDHGEQDYEPEPPVAEQYFSGSAAKFNGFGGDAKSEQLGPVLPPRQLPAFMSPARPERYDAEASGLAQEAGEDYGDYYDEPPRPRQRGGLVVIMAVLGLVVVGTAGAFAYRAMFGSAAFPSLPPIIKASLGPNKIVPNNSAAQADNAAQSSAATPATPDKLVSREEQPVNMEPPKLGSRVVATIPIGAAPMPPSSTAAAPAPGRRHRSALHQLQRLTRPQRHLRRCPRRPLCRRHQRRHRLRLRPSRKKSTRYSSMRISLAPWAPNPPRRRRGVPAPPHRQPRPVPQPRPLVAPRTHRCRSCPVQKARRSRRRPRVLARRPQRRLL